jgi:hypothetical protein
LTISTQASRETSRLERRTRAGRPTDDSLRAAAQEHMDARQQRLEDYVTSLQIALEASPTDDMSVRIADRLAQAQKDAHAAARRRIPQAKPAPLKNPIQTTESPTSQV